MKELDTRGGKSFLFGNLIKQAFDAGASIMYYDFEGSFDLNDSIKPININDRMVTITDETE